MFDDEPANAVLLDRILRRAGYGRVHTGGDPTQLASVLVAVDPDIILLDWHMPGFDGADVLGVLRSDTRWSRVPVIVLTADAGARLEALDLGATDFLTKPFDHTEILLRVRNALRTRRLHLELEATSEVLDRRVRDRTEDLRRANERLRQAEFVRRDFIAMASHEMRTPVTVIRGFVELWLHHGLPADGAAPQLGAMLRNVRRMEHLVKNLLLASRVESGADTHRRAVFEMPEILDPDLLLAFSEHPLDITCEVQGRFEGDPELLAHVVANLVSNASRYGAPPIEVRAAPVPGGAVVSVTDHGPGVDEAFLPALFERFTQATVGDRRTARGTGLGLWVSRQIVEMHGGRLWYEQEPATGAVFAFRLPLPEYR